jgi:argininosuccinate lyase
MVTPTWVTTRTQPIAFADLRVNRAWSTALAKVGVFTAAELAAVHAAIDDLAAHWRRTGIPAGDAAEDVHSLVERELVARLLSGAGLEG